MSIQVLYSRGLAQQQGRISRPNYGGSVRLRSPQNSDDELYKLSAETTEAHSAESFLPGRDAAVGYRLQWDRLYKISTSIAVSFA